MTHVSYYPVSSSCYKRNGMAPYTGLLEDMLFASSNRTMSHWLKPRTNVIEKNNEFIIEMVVPGFQRNNIEIKFENNHLLVKGTRQDEKQDEGTYHRRDYIPSQFESRFELPESVMSEKINARYNDGILSIILPKQPESVKTGPVTISIE